MQNKTIDSVLERGTKLDDLVGKSNDLSDHILMRWRSWLLTSRVENVLQAGQKDELMLYDYVSCCFECLFLRTNLWVFCRIAESKENIEFLFPAASSFKD